jgi:type VI secretion system secreted protein VgrG
MNSMLTQDTRLARLDTPLGKDVLVLIRFDGHEGLGELFEFRIDALSEKEDVDFDKAIGRACSVTYKSHRGTERVFNGILVEAEWLGIKDHFQSYRLVLRPWTWLLSRTSDCRIFKEMKAPDIIKKVFQDRGFSDFDLRLKESYPTLEYCVQYRETDLAFVTRLMEHHGIYYFFEHSADKHIMVLADAKSSHQAIPNCSKLPFIRFGEANKDDVEHVVYWSSQRRFRTGKVTFNDYDYLKPSADLMSEVKGSAGYNKSDMEQYDYPGKYKERNDGEKYAKVLLEAEQSLDRRRYATGDASNLFPGGLTTLEKHSKDNDEYLVVRSSHTINNQPYRSSLAEGRDEIYSGSYEFLPSSRPFRTQIVTPKPRIYGVQTAKVVGQEGEEIDVDEHGRILVEFHWVRADKDSGKKKPSRRVRVAQVWSGKQWGGQMIPRIGMEAVVEFVEGDPDRPLVIGTVYNGEYKVPYDLPANKTQSGLKSDSSKGHGGYNEFMFEDKKGQEKIGLHAQKDLDLVVLDTETREIGQSHMKPGPSRKTTLMRGDDELTLLMGSQTTTLAMGSQTTTIAQNRSTTVGMAETHTVGGPLLITSTTMITLTVGPSSIIIDPSGVKIVAPTVAIAAPGGVAIKGATVPVAF